METFLHLFTNALLLMVAFGALWFVSYKIKDPSFIDSVWAFAIAAVAVSSFLIAKEGVPARKLLLTGLALAWGLRLGTHLFLRWRREGADRRYRALMAGAREKRRWSYAKTTALFVFAPQCALVFLVSLPLQLGQQAHGPELGVLAMFGATLAAFGIGYEAVADHQLHRFKTDPANEDKVMDRGLWAWSRHPNYFGEICVWWGLWLISAETLPGLFAVISPIFVTFTLVKWSGAPLMESTIAERRPGYADYAARTPAIIPRPPRG